MWPFFTFGLLRDLVWTGWDWLEEAWHPKSGAGLLGLLAMSVCDGWNMSRVRGGLALGSLQGHRLHLTKSLRDGKDTLVGVTLGLDLER